MGAIAQLASNFTQKTVAIFSFDIFDLNGTNLMKILKS